MARTSFYHESTDYDYLDWDAVQTLAEEIEADRLAAEAAADEFNEVTGSVAANRVFAGPSSGSDDAAEFRALTADDLPVSTQAEAEAGAVDTSVMTPERTAQAIEGYAFDWSGGTSGAPSLSIPNVMSGRWVDARAYCPSNDTLDAKDGLTAAITAAAAGSGEVVLTGDRHYTFTDRNDCVLTIPSKVRLINAGKATLDWSGVGIDSSAKFFIRPEGSLGTTSLLSADVGPGDTEIDVADAGSLGLSLGAMIYLKEATNVFLDGDTSKHGELLTVKEVDGNTIHTFEAVQGTYLTSGNSFVQTTSPVDDVHLVGLKIVGPGPFTSTTGDRGIVATLFRNLRIIDCEVSRMGAMSALIKDGMGGSLSGGRWIKESPGSNTSVDYNIAYADAVQDFLIEKAVVKGGSAGIIQTNYNSVGVSRNVRAANNAVSGCYANGMSMHVNCEHITYDHNFISGCLRSVNASCRSARIIGNKGVKHVGVGTRTGLYLTQFVEDIYSERNLWADADRGVLLGPSDEQEPGSLGPIDLQIVRDTILDTTIAVDLQYDDTTDTKKGLLIDRVTTRRTGSQSINVVGTFSGRVVNNDCEGDGSHAWLVTSSVVNLEIRGNRYSDHTAEIVSGTQLRGGDNKPFSAFTPRTVTAAATLSLTNVEDVVFVDGTTQIRRIASAAERAGDEVTLVFLAAPIVTHNNSGSGTANDIFTATAANFTAAAGLVVKFVSDGTVWRETNRAFQPLDSTLTALAAYNTDGLIAQTAADTFAGRTLTGTANEITVTNGNGVSGNPTISLPSALAFTGKTVTGGTFDGATLSTRLVKGTYVIAASAVASAHTGDTNETALATVTVPANVMGANGIVHVTTLWSYTNSANTKTLRVRYGGASGTQYLATTPTTTGAIRVSTYIQNRNATNSQVGGPNAVFAYGTGASVVTSSRDTTAAQDIVMTAQLASSGETITLEGYIVELIVP